MSVLSWLERRLKRFAIPHLTPILVLGQLFAFVAAMSDPSRLDIIQLVPERILHGEVWRLVTFLFVPPITNVVFLFFGLYFFWIMGTALEGYWGAFRYNVFLLIAVVMTLATAWVSPDEPSTNGFIYSSVFLAFAFLYPDFIIYLFFILPIKIKWLALLDWCITLYMIIFGSWLTRALALASIANVLLFFWPEILAMARKGKRHMESQTKVVPDRHAPLHTCAVCGVTDKSDPKMEFRYCPLCSSDTAYCINHIHNHEHRGKKM